MPSSRSNESLLGSQISTSKALGICERTLSMRVHGVRMEDLEHRAERLDLPHLRLSISSSNTPHSINACKEVTKRVVTQWTVPDVVYHSFVIQSSEST